MRPIPLLFLSDSPHLTSGLARITKDLATIASRLPQFRVGVLGRGGYGTSQLPFMQYNFPESAGWGEEYLELVWRDFTKGTDGRGVLFTVWDLSRLGWLMNPIGIGGTLGDLLRNKPFQTWAYAQIDGHGIGGRLTAQCADTLNRFDRPLAYTLFGKQVMEQSIGREVDWIPHGFNERIFKPRGKEAGRGMLGVEEDQILVGMVATNQVRKDWGTAFGAIAQLKNKIRKLKFWAHIDVPDRHWNLMALAEDFGLQKTVHVTYSGQYSSEQLSYLYSACDLTILPSSEGFGYPIVESLACGVPVVHGNYGGGAELVPSQEWLVEPTATRLEGPWNVVRPVWSPNDWADRMEHVLELGERPEQEFCTGAVEHLQWKNLGSVWEKWMLAGIGQ